MNLLDLPPPPPAAHQSLYTLELQQASAMDVAAPVVAIEALPGRPDLILVHCGARRDCVSARLCFFVLAKPDSS